MTYFIEHSRFSMLYYSRKEVMTMKIEKLNDNQIRCTLTRADLAARHLQLSELAYGTEKAKSLFRDMMQQAAFEFGFEAEDLPLMIEAIPASSDSIVLIITKVEDPEELDTRFSKFAPSPGGDWDSPKKEPPSKLEGADTLLELLDKVKEKFSNSIASDGKEDTPAEQPKNVLRLFSFPTMNSVLKAARLLSTIYSGSNTLYKDREEDVYILAMTQSEHTINDFNRICNMLSEYGSLETSSGRAFLEEQCEMILSTDAVQKLAQV